MNGSSSDLNISTLTFTYTADALLRDCRIKPPTSYSRLYCTISTILGIVSGIVFPIIGSFGVLSNFHVFYVNVFRMSKPTRQTTYLACLALADTLHLTVYGWLWVFPAKGLPYITNGKVSFFSLAHSDFVCRLHRFGHLFSSFLATTFMAVAAVDRTLAMFMPFRFHGMSSRVAWFTSLAVTLVGLAINLPFTALMGHYIFYYANSRAGTLGCWFVHKSDFWNIMQLIYCNTGVLQTGILLLSNIALIYKLRQVRANRCQLSEGHAAVTTNTSQTVAASNKEISASLTIIILSTVFFVTSLPTTLLYLIAYFVQNYTTELSGVHLYYNLADTLWILFFAQESTNWIVYMIQMKSFREAALRTLPCSWFLPSSQSSSSNLNNYKVVTPGNVDQERQE